MLRESLGLTDAGMRNFKRGVFFCALANLVLMAPLCVLFLLVAAFFDHLVAGAPLPDLAVSYTHLKGQAVWGRPATRMRPASRAPATAGVGG